MYAEIEPDDVNLFKPVLEIGPDDSSLYPPKPAFKPVEAPYMLWFIRFTLVEEKANH